MSGLHALHNRLAPEIVTKLTKEVTAAGGADADLWLMLESIALGVILVCERQFGATRETSIESAEMLIEAVFERLGKIPPGARPPVPR